MSKKVKHIAAGILLLIFTIYYVNVTLFTHSHIINGVTIVHSHFHTNDHTQTGTHSESEITLISALSAFQSLAAASFFAALGFFVLITGIVRIIYEKKITSSSATCLSLRAPPSIVA